MTQIKPISYANLIKYSFEVIGISNNSIIFNFVGTPFRVYSGKPIIFTFDGTIYQSKYYRNMIGGSYKNILYLSETPPAIPTNTILDTYDTFNIDNNNELPTIQDIIDILGIGTSSNIHSSYGTPTDISDGTKGLISSEDRLKLNQIKFSVTESEKIELTSNSYKQIFQILLSEKSKSYTIALKSNNKIVKLLLDVNYENSAVDISGYIKDCTFDGLKLQFIVNTYTLPDSSTVRYLLIAAQDIATTEYKFTYETQQISDHILLSGVFQESNFVTINGLTELTLQTNMINFHNTHIKYPEINWNDKQW